MRKIRDKGIAKLAAAAERSSKRSPMKTASLRRDMNQHGFTLEQAELFESLPRDVAWELLGKVQSFKEKHGWPDELSPLVRGYWGDLLRQLSSRYVSHA
jgi:hypothetical protein